MPRSPQRPKTANGGATGAGAQPAKGDIRIRMYRVGFGDCFLVTFMGERAYHALIDCGVHSQGNIGMLPDAVKNIGEETGSHLDLVIATHAHQDHISGFGSQAATFRGFTVGEVWMPWTEDPNDATAVKLRTKRAALTAALNQHFAAVPASPAATAALANLTGNGPALQLLHDGIHGGKVSYPRAGAMMNDAAGMKSLTARVLGPPDNEKFLAQMDPPAGDRYFRPGAGGAPEPANGIKPFPDRWRVPRESWPSDVLDADGAKALAAMAADPEGLAFSLTNAMNNTSLVILFSFGGRNLLFPGDAQYGNWSNWIDDPSAKQILETIDFYKVSHHGSLNATPKRAVEGMTDQRFAAMVSTQNTPWPSIPRMPLMQALLNRSCGLARSDSIQVPDATTVPGGAPPVFVPGKFWYDYTIKG
jgi:beta-lactamase superfamily II metal-dependent hydrolase